VERKPRLAESERIDQRAREAAAKLWRAAALRDEELALEAALEVREVMRADAQLGLLIRLPFDGGELEPTLIKLRAPCRSCGWEMGIVRPLRGQRVVRCAACESHAHTLSATNSGESR
jgi:hypothetical protein